METEKLKWPFNLMYEVNKEIEDEHERLPETDDAAPKDLLAVIAYIFTRIATNCTTKTRIQGASFILRRYRDHKRVAEIAEEYGVSTALVYAYTKTTFQVLAKCDLYRNLMRYGMDDYLRNHRRKYSSDGYNRGYEEGYRSGKIQSSEVKADALTIEDLFLSVRAYNCLKRSGVENVSDLVAMKDEDFLNVRNLGCKSVEEIYNKLVSIGRNPEWTLAGVQAVLRRRWNHENVAK